MKSGICGSLQEEKVELFLMEIHSKFAEECDAVA